MLGGSTGVNILVVIAAAGSYGSSYVPARSFEIHDGIIFNWYQCIGLLLTGMAFSMFTNDWSAPAGQSPGFYVHPEGLISGVIYQLASIIAIQAVKKVGLGIYYTVHEFSNVGATLVVGFLGPYFGIPVKVPSNVGLALFGAFVIGLGMVPTMFMQDMPEEKNDSIESPAKSEGVNVTDITRRASEKAKAGAQPLKAVADLYFPLNSPQVSFKEANAATWDSMIKANAHTWDGSHVPPMYQKTVEQFSHITGGLPSVPAIYASESEDELDDNPFSPLPQRQSSYERRLNTRTDKIVGLVLSLIAGTLFGLMFAPMPYWQQRMAAAGLKKTAADFVFAVCVGASLTSTLNLLLWSTVKKIRNERLAKSVLRPALAAGIIYYAGMLLEFYAISLMPYAVAYTACTGLALAVSMGWGIFVFGEMKGFHNRLMAALSFAGVIAGAAIMAMSS